MELGEFLAEDFSLKFLKWTEIILQEDKAVKLDAMYVLVRDSNYCDLIFIDGKGRKRKIQNVSKEVLISDFPLKDLSNLSDENIDNWKDVLGSLDGESATIEVGETTSLNPGEQPVITNSGTSKDAIFNFAIPVGDTGLSATIYIGEVVTVNPEEEANVINVGNENNAVFNFEIPKGEKGDDGEFILEYNDPEDTIASDITTRADLNSGVMVNYRETTTWYDGSPINDTLIDNDIFIKIGNIYKRKTIDPNTLLKVDTIVDLRNQNGYYEGHEISLLGYYMTGDKQPLNYKFTINNFNTNVDDGGSIIKSSKGSWIAQFDTKVSIKDFGALGDGVFDNCLILQRVVDFCIQRNFIMYIPKGVFVTDSSKVGGNNHAIMLNNWTAEMQGLHMKGEGKGVSIIKEADGATNAGGRYTRMFYCYLGINTTDYRERGSYIFEGITFDKNARGNVNNEVLYFYEQSHIITFAGNGNSYIPEVISKDCEFVDKIGGGINFSSSTHGRIGAITIDNLYSINHPNVTRSAVESSNRFGQRGCVEVVMSSSNCIISDSNMIYSQTEPVLEATKDRPRHYNISNSRIDVFEYTDRSYYAYINCTNLTSKDEFLVRYTQCNVTNSTVSVKGFITSRNLQINNCTIKIPYNELDNTITPFSFAYVSGVTGLNQLSVSDSVFEIDSTNVNLLPTGNLINGGTGDYSNYNFIRAFTNCVFDTRVEKTANCLNNGTWRFQGCNIVGYGTEALIIGHSLAGGGRYSNVTIIDCEYSKVTNKIFALNTQQPNHYTYIKVENVPFSKLYRILGTGEYYDKFKAEGFVSASIPLGSSTHAPKGLLVENSGDKISTNIKGWIKKITSASSSSTDWEIIPYVANIATEVREGLVKKSAAVANVTASDTTNVTLTDLVTVTSPDAADLPTVITLLNELKAKYNLNVPMTNDIKAKYNVSSALSNANKVTTNAKLTADRTSGQQTP